MIIKIHGHKITSQIKIIYEHRDNPIKNVIRNRAPKSLKFRRIQNDQSIHNIIMAVK